MTHVGIGAHPLTLRVRIAAPSGEALSQATPGLHSALVLGLTENPCASVTAEMTARAGYLKPSAKCPLLGMSGRFRVAEQAASGG